MAPPMVLWVLLAARATALSCVCTPSECEEVLEWECPGGGVVWDSCGCCRVCARVEDEPCGGPDGFHGSCASGLHCVLDPTQLLSHRTQRGEARGTCKRVPGILLGALSAGSAPGKRVSEAAHAITHHRRAKEDFYVHGCYIVERVCLCSQLPEYREGSRGWKRREGGGGRGGGRRGGNGKRGGRRRRVRRKRRSREAALEVDMANKSPYTFSTLVECEMNLAEILKQEEEIPTSDGIEYLDLDERNCTKDGCETSDGDPPSTPNSDSTKPCPVGSARAKGIGRGPSSHCICFPSLCPMADLPFSCPFGARVLRRASRIPGDCCDQYECASPPQDVRRKPIRVAVKEGGSVSTGASTSDKIGGRRSVARKVSVCPGGIEEPEKLLSGCEIAGRTCRCRHLPPCSTVKRQDMRSGRIWKVQTRLKREIKAEEDGREEWEGRITKGRHREELKVATGSPFTFATLEECMDRLANNLQKDREEEEGREVVTSRGKGNEEFIK